MTFLDKLFRRDLIDEVARLSIRVDELEKDIIDHDSVIGSSHRRIQELEKFRTEAQSLIESLAEELNQLRASRANPEPQPQPRMRRVAWRDFAAAASASTARKDNQ